MLVNGSGENCGSDRPREASQTHCYISPGSEAVGLKGPEEHLIHHVLILQTGKLPTEGGDVSEAIHRAVPNCNDRMEPNQSHGKRTRMGDPSQPPPCSASA